MTDAGGDGSLPDSTPRRWMVEVLPGSMARFGKNPDDHRIAVPLWLKWCQIARRDSALAAEVRAPDSHIDAMSAKLAHVDHPEDTWGPRDVSELECAMSAIVAAALALDGFYGSVKAVIPAPKMNAARARQILELLKLGFAIGREAQRWMTDLDWLFDLRDRAVHHAEVMAPYVVVRKTELTDVVGARESYELSALNAKRAAAVSGEVLSTCLMRPKPAMKEWCEKRNSAAEVLRIMTSSPTGS